MTGPTAKEKGDALEDAVRAIESTILSTSPSFNEGTFVIEPKKIIVVDGVKHELDIHVTATLGPGYDAVFIFECKNWQAKVDKNEIIVFSEKIKASGAQRGFFVAAELTSSALAQAKLDPRIVVLKAAQLDPTAMMVPGAFHGVHVGHTSANLLIHGKEGGTKRVNIDPKTAAVVIDGNPVDTQAFLEETITAARTVSLNSFNSVAAGEGMHKIGIKGERSFAQGTATIDGKPMLRIEVTGETEVTISKGVVVSAFEVATRGRHITVQLRMPGAELRASFVEIIDRGPIA